MILKFMKRFFVLTSLVFASLDMMAQEHEMGKLTWQPRAGISVATLIDGKGDAKDGYRVGLAVGAELEYQIANRWGLGVGLLYAAQGSKIEGNAMGNPSYTVQMDYINVPLFAKWYIVKNKRIALKAGIQPGFNVRERAKGNGIDQSLE